MLTSMSPRRKDEHPVEVHPEYLAELRRRVESGPGVVAVAKQAGISRRTVWRLLNAADQRPTVEAAERVRAALAALEPGGAPLPSPIILVRGPRHPTWKAALLGLKPRR